MGAARAAAHEIEVRQTRRKAQMRWNLDNGNEALVPARLPNEKMLSAIDLTLQFWSLNSEDFRNAEPRRLDLADASR